MAFRVRTSKFRHVFGEPFRKERCYENVRITRNAHDGNFCAVNPKYIAVVTESAGGGAFIVLPLSRTGRVDINTPKVCGHAGGVMEIKWNPFKDEIIASGADDNSVKIWQIPEGGLRTNLSEWQVDLHGHARRVLYLEWHPTAENIILTAGADHKCIVWNIEQAEPVNVISCHGDMIQSMSWSRDGSMFCTTCKDKTLRVIDPRAGGCVSKSEKFFSGMRPSKATFLGDSGKIFCTGFENRGERECAIWDVRNMQERLTSRTIDSSFGILMPYYDHDTRCVFLAGKGDGNISYFEIVNDSPYVHYLNNFGSPSPQRGLGVMPKRGCDPSQCEIMRFYKLHAARNYVEPISMIVPRKNNLFHEDIFPPTASAIPSLSADEWISGQNRDPILISMKDKEVVNDPKATPSRAVQYQDGGLNQAPTITTYKAVSSQKSQSAQPSPPPTSSTSTSKSTSSGAASSSSKSASSSRQEPKKIPASLRNIRQLSTNEDIITLQTKKEEAPNGTITEEKADKAPSETERAFVNSKIAAFERSTSSSNGHGDQVASPPRRRLDRKSWSSCQENPPDVIANGMKSMTEKQTISKDRPSSVHDAANYFEHKEIEIVELKREDEDHNSKGDGKDIPKSPRQALLERNKSSPGKLIIGNLPDGPKDQGDGHKIHVKKTWSPVKPQSNAIWEESMLPNTDPELRKAYFRQAEEIKALREQLSLKDKRIRQLEDEVNILRKGGGGAPAQGESNC